MPPVAMSRTPALCVCWMTRCVCFSNRDAAACPAVHMRQCDARCTSVLSPCIAQTYETVDRQPMEAYEQGCSLISLSFADDPSEYYVVGTAYALPDEPEPSKVLS